MPGSQEQEADESKKNDGETLLSTSIQFRKVVLHKVNSGGHQRKGSS